jgi:hypothetical protein
MLGKCSVRFSVGTPATLIQAVRVSPNSLVEKAGIVTWSEERFLPDHFEFIIYHSSNHSTLYSPRYQKDTSEETKFHGFSPQENYTDRATAACRPTFVERVCHVVSITKLRNGIDSA